MLKLSCLLIAAVFFTQDSVALSPVQKGKVNAKFLSASMECIQQYRLTADDLKAMKAKMLPDKENTKCFAACLFKKIGIMDDMGNLTPTGATQTAQQMFGNDEEQVKKVDGLMNDCTSVNMEKTSDGEKGCDRAKLIFTCLSDKAPQHGFHIDF